MADILTRRTAAFVVWRADPAAPPPALVIGTFAPGNPPTLAGQRRVVLAPEPAFPDLFTLPARPLGLAANTIYHYWFEVAETRPDRPAGQRVLVTDPFAWAVDWRLRAPRLPAPYTSDDRQPAAVILWTGQQLAPADPGGEIADLAADNAMNLPPNNQLVMYEMPTAWSLPASPNDLGIGVGTFQDVLALVDPAATGANFADLAVTAAGQSYLTNLGINALELLPPTDSFYKREWGYDPAHYLAPDASLGFPDGYTSSIANRDLARLIAACHANNIRFFVDAVMAFATHEAFQTIAFNDFCIADPKATPNDPDARNSRPDHDFRDGFGSTLWRYARPARGYDPISGQPLNPLYPARQLMLTFASRWIEDFHIDGVRIDSVENVANWDFLQQFKDHVRATFAARRPAGSPAADPRILVVGEELSDPIELLTQNRLDGLWNYHFSGLCRSAVLGGSDGFESVVRQMVDCRNLGFPDGAKAVNYITSHDVEGLWNMRLFNFLLRMGVPQSEVFRRIKLGFACLLTAVGIPMMLAGEEFGDQHTRFDENGNVDQSGGKQVDPVNYSLTTQPDRADLLVYVSRLVKLRTSHPALGANDTQFLQVDQNDGKRVFAWMRGPAVDPVITVANFSAWGTSDPFNPASEYVVPNWPAGNWQEVTRARPAPQAGRESLFPWEAKVYRRA
jgi:pullulanase